MIHPHRLCVPAAAAVGLSINVACLGQGGMNGRFEASSPAVGQPLPEVMLFDAAGDEVKLHEIKGHYTVLVFGCLT
jgi:cytochrome oxidase Cu insertion factor (SCO1/SenC/PrrC family)